MQRLSLFSDFERKYIEHLNGRIFSSFMSLIKTTTIEKLSRIVDKVISNPKVKRKKGIVINGPKGTGKSCALYYLMHYLKSKKQRALLLGPERIGDEEVMEYFEKFVGEQNDDFKKGKLELSTVLYCRNNQ